MVYFQFIGEFTNVNLQFLFCKADYAKHNLKIRFFHIFSIAFIKYIYMFPESYNFSRNGIKDKVYTVLVDRHP